MTVRPLQGIRVTDFSWALAGPYCTMLMALAGAEVIRVETMRRVDFIRFSAVRRPDTPEGSQPQSSRSVNESSRFNTVNLNKQGVRLDLNCPEAVELAKALVRVSDVVVENYRPGTMERLGLGYDELRRLHPGVIMIGVSGMGQDGPERSYTAMAHNFGALSCMSHLTTYPDGIPTEMRTPMDLLTGTTAYFAVLAALHHRQVTGEGQYIDLAAREAITSFLGDILLDYPMNQESPQPIGNRHSFLAPHGVYPCKEEDSWISLAVGTDAEWQALCEVMRRPELAVDLRFADGLSRWRHQDELDALIGEWTQGCADLELMHLLQGAGVAAMPSFSSKELIEDEHLGKRRVFTQVTHPELGRQVVTGPPFRLEETPMEAYGAAPLMGQHNREVFCGLLGLSEQDVERLTRDQVLY